MKCGRQGQSNVCFAPTIQSSNCLRSNVGFICSQEGETKLHCSTQSEGVDMVGHPQEDSPKSTPPCPSEQPNNFGIRSHKLTWKPQWSCSLLFLFGKGWRNALLMRCRIHGCFVQTMDNAPTHFKDDKPEWRAECSRGNNWNIKLTVNSVKNKHKHPTPLTTTLVILVSSVLSKQPSGNRAVPRTTLMG